MTEKLALDQILRNGRAIDRDQLSLRARAVAVDLPCYQFLTGTTLARDENGDVRLGDLLDQRVDAFHSLASSDQ